MKARLQVRKVIKQICPPIVLTVLSKIIGVVVGGANQDDGHGEQNAGWYNSNYAKSVEFRKPFYQSVYYPLWSVIADRIVSRGFKSVNDIGCGAGQVAQLLHFHGIQTYRGMDLSEEAVGLANSRGTGYEFEVRDVIANPPTDLDKFDCTISLEFLEHVEQDLDVMSALPEGHKFLGTVPNFPFVSHVRHFENEEEVAARYRRFFQTLSITTHMGEKKGKLFFLLDGVVGSK